jgi:hypothetical protein
MEWMLQVIDEIDDAIAALRQCSLGLAAELGLLPSGSLWGTGSLWIATLFRSPMERRSSTAL